MLSVKQGGIKYNFLSMTQPGIEPRSPGPLTNTLLIRLIFGFEILEKTSIVHNTFDFLEFVTPKLKLIVTFVQRSIRFVPTKNKNL